MKKTLLFLTFILTFQFSNAQYTTKTLLTLEIYNALYGNGSNPNDYPAANYPVVFMDLAEGSDFEKMAKLLTYLVYDDAVPVIWSEPQFNVAQIPYHVSVIKSLIEAWDIPIVSSGVSLPYSDVNPDTLYYEYVLTAYSIGMLDNSSNLYPYTGLLLSDMNSYISFLVNNYPTPTQSQLLDADNYFQPNIFSPNNLSFTRGVEQGVFSHYAKNSFVIPDRKMNLNFSHFYSTQMVEIPENFYPIKPMGRGWSHTYNSYIYFKEDAGDNNDDLFYIVWPDGTIHIFNEDENEYVSIGVYDDFDESSSSRIYITKKNQVRYKYQKLDSDRDIYYLTEIRDPNGNEINIDYESAEEDDTRRIEEVEAPSGKKLEFRYRNNTDLVERIEDPIGRRLEFEYSNLWQNYHYTLVQFEDAKGNDTTYQYYIDDQYEQYLLRRIDLPRGNEIEATYNDDGKLETYQINNDDPIEVTVDFDFENDTYTSEVEVPIPSGGTLSKNYTFNANGLVTDYSSDTNNVQVSYPSTGNNVTLPSFTNSNGVEVDYEYDSDGNVTKIDKEDGDVVEEFEYDSDNNLTEYTDAEGNVTKFFYDSDENLTGIEDALGNLTTFSYDTYGQLLSKTNQEGITVNYTYESDGALSTIDAPEGINSSFSYDGVNRLLQRNDNGLITAYQYDQNDNITQLTDSGGFATTYDYDANDNLTQITNANGINTSFEYDNEDRVIEEQFGTLVTEYEYGDEGYLERTTKPSGQNIDYEYDSDGQLEETGTITDISYNSRNLVRRVENDTGTMRFEYDNLNLLDEFTTVHGHEIEYSYSDVSLVERIDYPIIDGVELTTRYNYDDKNRLNYIYLESNLSINGTLAAQYEYYDDDRIKRIDFGNNTYVRYLYDNAGRLNYIRHQKTDGEVTIYQANHQLNERGNITQSIQEFTPMPPGHLGNSGTDNIINYSYDDNNQIITAETSYNVDDDGNTVDIGTDIDLVFDIDDRLTDYSDVDNTLSFKYNGYNQRVEATRNGVTTKYVRDVRTDNILVELDASNTPLYFYIYSSSGTLVARMKPNGDLFYYHGDIRGSTIMMTDSNANITHHYRYDDFGTVIRQYEPDNEYNQFRYVGTYGVEYELNDLYYMRARYYRPSIGRFLSEDPIWHTNLYPYADNNPITKIDPKGEIPVETVLDVASIGLSSAEFNANPTLKNGAFLAWDISASLLPYVPGSYVLRGSKYIKNTISASGRTEKVFDPFIDLLNKSDFDKILKGKGNGLQFKMNGNARENFNNLIQQYNISPSQVKTSPDGVKRFTADGKTFTLRKDSRELNDFSTISIKPLNNSQQFVIRFN